MIAGEKKYLKFINYLTKFSQVLYSKALDHSITLYSNLIELHNVMYQVFLLFGEGELVSYLVSAVVIIFKQFHNEFEHFRWTDGMNVSQ